MKNIITILLILQLYTPLSAQKAEPNSNEELLQTDTVMIAPKLRPMIFNFYHNNKEGYFSSDGRQFGRLEVFIAGNPIPIQMDTVDDVGMVDFKDMNFDNFTDLSIVTVQGMSGDNNSTDIYFYNPATKKFEFGIGGLSNPYVNNQDSTLSSSGYCCRGKSGNSEKYKYKNGEFIKISESEYSENGSWAKTLIGDSMVTTSYQTIVDMGENKFIDSSWEYLFDKLRLVNVTKEEGLDHSPTPAQRSTAIADEDVMGSFLYESKETFEYKKEKSGNIICLRKFDVVKNNKWVKGKPTQIPLPN